MCSHAPPSSFELVYSVEMRLIWQALRFLNWWNYLLLFRFLSLLKITYFLKFGCSFWLKTNSVKENFRRLGHGEALLKAAIQKCRTRNVHRITLHLDPLRTPAMNLYKKYGFQVDNLIEGYYSSDRNAYRMYLDFDSD